MTRAEIRKMTDEELAVAAAEIQAEQDQRYRTAADHDLKRPLGDAPEVSAVPKPSSPVLHGAASRKTHGL